MLGDALKDEGYEISVFAQELLNNGFTGNGCGSGKWSFIIAKVAQLLFSVNYHKACLIHDAEWSILKNLRTQLHRLNSDRNLELNLILDSGANGLSVTKLRLAAAFHAAVVINSPTDYWE